MKFRLNYELYDFVVGGEDGINDDYTVDEILDEICIDSLEEWCYTIISDDLRCFNDIPREAVEDFIKSINCLASDLWMAFQDELEGDEEAITNFVEYYKDGFYLGNFDINIEFYSY